MYIKTKVNKRNQIPTFAGNGAALAHNVPGGRFEEVRLAVHQLRPELGHLLLHFAHFAVESLADAREFRIDDAEVAQLDRDVAFVGVGHFGWFCDGFRAIVIQWNFD